MSPTSIPPEPPEDWQQLADETSKERPARRYSRAFSGPQRRPPWIMGAVLVAAWTLTIWGWYSAFNPWPPGPSKQELLDGQEAAMALAAEAIRGYARGHQGQYPTELNQVLSLNLVIEYRVTERGFELQARGAGGTPILLRSE